MAEVRISEGFEEDLGIVLSDKVLDDILRVIEILPTIPSMGSTDVAAALAYEYGEGVRKNPRRPLRYRYLLRGRGRPRHRARPRPPACCPGDNTFPRRALATLA